MSTGRGAARVVAVVDAEEVVRRADHVEVEVQRDVVRLLLRQVLDVVLRSEQTLLLGSPPGEAHRVVRLGLRHLDRGLQQRCAAGAVVVDARAVLHAVEVGAGHDGVGVIAALGLGEHVVGRARLRRVVDRHRHRRTGGGVEVLAGRRRSCRPRGSSGPVASPIMLDQAVATRLALVHDDRAGGAGCLRVERLDGESARAALHRARSLPAGKPAKSRGLAAAGVAVGRIGRQRRCTMPTGTSGAGGRALSAKVDLP